MTTSTALAALTTTATSALATPITMSAQHIPWPFPTPTTIPFAHTYICPGLFDDPEPCPNHLYDTWSSYLATASPPMSVSTSSPASVSVAPSVSASGLISITPLSFPIDSPASVSVVPSVSTPVASSIFPWIPTITPRPLSFLTITPLPFPIATPLAPPPVAENGIDSAVVSNGSDSVGPATEVTSLEERVYNQAYNMFHQYSGLDPVSREALFDTILAAAIEELAGPQMTSTIKARAVKYTPVTTSASAIAAKGPSGQEVASQKVMALAKMLVTNAKEDALSHITAYKEKKGAQRWCAWCLFNCMHCKGW